MSGMIAEGIKAAIKASDTYGFVSRFSVPDEEAMNVVLSTVREVCRERGWDWHYKRIEGKVYVLGDEDGKGTGFRLMVHYL